MLKGVRKYFLVVAFTFVVFAISILTSLSSVFAANPQSVDYNVYVKPSLSISASTNTVTIDLNPNSKQFGSANLDVTVGTNNLYGYKLFMTTDSNATALERDDTADSISDSIPTLSSSTTTSTFPANYWGYRINNDVGGMAGIIDTTGTNFYPYVPANNPVISSATEATNEQTANLTFGAKIDYEKKAGLYELTLKFNALPIVSTYYMQDIAADPTLADSVCTETPTVVLDKRDEQSYTIRRIGGDCWMVENLRFTGTTMDSTTSNVAPQYTPSNPYVATYYDLEGTEGSSSSGHCYQGSASAESGYLYSCIHEGDASVTNTPIDDSTTGTIHTVWYNYAAATAGTITGYSNTNPQHYDICPAGWGMPTKSEAGTIVSKSSKFNLLYGGRYINGVLNRSSDYGSWWISDTQAVNARYILYNIPGTVSNEGYYPRTSGTYIRCVIKGPTNYLYDAVAGMSKGTQTAADLQAAITVPTSADRTQDTSNSGVYEYDASEFGTATDASNDYKIYYYRGVLENSVGSYGSDGSAVTYPNYVKLGNTCWRILRTTGSGGVKMIYNGNWTGSTCANSTTNAQIGTNTFSVNSNKLYGSALGYTQNSSYNSSNLSATYGTMFGSNTSFSANSTDSGAKTSIENWYNNTSGIKTTYGSHLEADAGYCNNRTLNEGTSWTTPMADSATVATSTAYYTGAYIRNYTTTKNPSLTCPRNNADVYTTSAVTTGNKQLSQPIALITADEASFAGSGRSNGAQGSSYHANSFLRSSSIFWLLSPYRRDSDGCAYVFRLDSSGYLDYGSVYNTLGVRPAISLSQGATISSGTGTATSPWEVFW